MAIVTIEKVHYSVEWRKSADLSLSTTALSRHEGKTNEAQSVASNFL